MAMTVYDSLAAAIQAAYAEREASEDARAAKIRAAIAQSGHADLVERLVHDVQPASPAAHK